jgi:hypothetical protein
MTQQLNRLTSLERVRDWVGSTTANDDLLLTRLIDSVSRTVLSYLQRYTLFQSTFTDTYDGYDDQTKFLRNWPVLSVSSVIIGVNTIAPFSVPPASSVNYLYGAGYVIEPWDGYPPGRPQALTLRNYRFIRGIANIQATYISGFVVQNEAQTVPATTPYTLPVNTPLGSWAVDQGVTYASSGGALTQVAYSPTATLSTGQYMAVNGNYYFAAGDAAANVLISYSYVPADLEQCVIDLIAERYSYKNRIGAVSKTLAGNETMSYSQKEMPDYVKLVLQPYKRVIMV